MNSHLLSIIRIDRISEHRSELMGIGILGVMLGHYLEWSQASGFWTYILKPFIGLVFTEGFLILSGFGLYYSFSNNSEVFSFYKKRFDRLVVPFWLLSVPYVFWLLFKGQTMGNILLHLSALDFWINGNTGMWYISVTILLYFLFPFLYSLLFKSGRLKVLLFIMTLFVLYMLPFVLCLYTPNYYEATYLGYTQIPMFLWGLGLGYMAYNGIHFKRVFLCLALLFCVVLFLKMQDGVFSQFGNGFQRLLYILILPSILDLSFVSKIFSTILKWFGTLSLELYVLHLTLHRVFITELGGGGTSALLSILVALVLAPVFHVFISWLQHSLLVRK